MICPFRCGVKHEYQYIGDNSKASKQNSDNYLELAQHCIFEECEENECPYYNSVLGCSRVMEEEETC